MYLHHLDSRQPDQAFPSLDNALEDPDGLLAVGGCLTPTRLINAYRHGIFPWFNPGEPILWWSPDPRLVLFPDKFKASRSLKKTMRRQDFHITYNQSFSSVVKACAEPRDESGGTWITQSMQVAYRTLYQRGIAHSVEVWQEDNLVGGLYGVAIGRVFFGESMFHRVTDASKVAFVGLVELLTEWGYELVDCQVSSCHLLSLGAENIPRANFVALLDRYCEQAPIAGAWG